MSCVKGAIDEIYFVRWVVPEVNDADAIVDEARDHCERLGQSLRYVAIIGAEVEPPSEDVRASMRRNMDNLLEYCSSVHLVIEGKGFRRAIARSISTSIFLLSKNRGRTFAHDTVEQALGRMGLEQRRIDSVLDRARSEGLLNVPAN